MKNLFWFLIIIIFFTSCNKKNLEINILNKLLALRDSLNIELKNNTNENYFFYFKRTKLDYFPN